MGPLSRSEYSALMRIMNNDNCFDRHDNCVQTSVREIERWTRIPKSTVNRLFKAMKILDLANNTIDIAGVQRVMVNPAFLYFHTFHDKRFHRAMYVLGSHEKAVEWLEVCRAHNRLYDPKTGEDIGFFDTEDDLRYANSYSRNDRDKIHQRDGYKDGYADGELGPSMEDCQILCGDPQKDKAIYDHWVETGEMDFTLYEEKG